MHTQLLARSAELLDTISSYESVLVITHEQDISEYGTRIVACRDGLIVSDKPVQERRLAEDELRALPVETVA